MVENYCNNPNYGTSIGIEWETNLCVFDPTNELNKFIKIPFSCLKGIDCSSVKEENKEGWELTLEKSPSECLHILEAQIGVSCSNNEKKINKEKLKEQIESFSNFWKDTVRKLNLNINGDDYAIIIRNDEIYCKGIPEKETIENMIGNLQISFGIKLEYIESLFKFISKKYNDNKEFIENPLYYLFSFISLSIDTTSFYLQSQFFIDFDKKDKDYEFTENDLNENGKLYYSLDDVFQKKINGFLILLNYIIITYEKNIFRSFYLKSWFILKLRSNLKGIHNYLTKEDKNREYYKKFLSLEKIMKDLSKVENLSKDILEWPYPYKENYNIFIEIRSIIKFLLVCDKNFIEKFDSNNIPIDCLQHYCNSFINILENVLDI
jgi:hypothetical protein